MVVLYYQMMLLLVVGLLFALYYGYDGLIYQFAHKMNVLNLQSKACDED